MYKKINWIIHKDLQMNPTKDDARSSIKCFSYFLIFFLFLIWLENLKPWICLIDNIHWSRWLFDWRKSLIFKYKATEIFNEKQIKSSKIKWFFKARREWKEKSNSTFTSNDEEIEMKREQKKREKNKIKQNG